MAARPAISGYVLGRRLGGGSTTDVYAAADRFGRLVAIKLLKKADDEDGRILLAREAVAADAVRHANVVRFRHADLDHSPPYLVTEYLPGESIRARLDRVGPPSMAIALGWLRQIAEGLAAMHQLGYVHGDVKPANVQITKPGKVILIDLGFARVPGQLSPWVERGHILGTANYLAPEMTTIPPADSVAVDLFSLGVMAFELLTGSLPYGGRSTQDVVRLRRNCEPATLGPAFPADLNGLVRQLTERDPANRPTATMTVHRLLNLQIATFARQAA